MMVRPKSQKIFAIIGIEQSMESSDMLNLVYKDFYQKCVWIKQMYPYNIGTLSTYNIMFNIFGFEDTVIGKPLVQSDTYEEAIDFLKDTLDIIPREYFGEGEWPIFYVYRYRVDKKDIVTYTISR